MALSKLTRQCGNGAPPGIKTRIYGIPKEEITTFAAATASAAYGDDKVLDDDFVLSVSGYWREYDILVDTGETLDELTGERGGRTVQNSAVFFIDGNDKGHRKLMDDFVAYDGCMIFLFPEKSGKINVIGDLDNPCFLDSAIGGSGGPENARRGRAYRIVATTGYSSPEYTGTIDVTP